MPHTHTHRPEPCSEMGAGVLWDRGGQIGKMDLLESYGLV